jgi:glutamate-5-semialdehyde dehydrogenase
MSLAEDQAKRARAASILLRKAPGATKSAAIRAMGARMKSRLEDILEANAADLDQARSERTSDAKLDRLRLDEKRIDELVKSLDAVAAQPDPVGKVVDEHKAPSGVTCRRVRVPLGVILMIYESRPNVTAEAAAVCLRSGNAVLLKGGHEADRTNRMIASCLQGALAQEGLPTDAVQLVEGGHEIVDQLVLLDSYIDLVIPRGGEGLIRSVAEKSRVPVIKHYKGNCHVYVDEAADPIMARTVVLNAKTQRPATCNAAEKLLIHEKVAEKLLPQIAERLVKAGVKLRGDDAARRLVKEIRAAAESDWSEEYLDLIMSVKVVKDLDEAIRHINQYGSAHTDAIVTSNEAAARRFLNEVDSSSVMWNCSTRLADGGQYGLGAEIGISTERLHARGPMGAEELTCIKWVVIGEGQLRT